MTFYKNFVNLEGDTVNLRLGRILSNKIKKLQRLCTNACEGNGYIAIGQTISLDPTTRKCRNTPYVLLVDKNLVKTMYQGNGWLHLPAELGIVEWMEQGH